MILKHLIKILKKIDSTYDNKVVFIYVDNMFRGENENTNQPLNTMLNTESHIINIENESRELERLKSILKNTQVESEDDAKLAENIIKIAVSLLCIIILAPIIICDLYYGYTDNSCVQTYPENLNINMKIYLLVSAYTEIGILITCIAGICFVSSKSIDKMNIYVLLPTAIIIFICLFSIIWNIIGAVVFWGNIYNSGNCDKNVSTYLFVTLIIKLVGNLSGVNQATRTKQK